MMVFNHLEITVEIHETMATKLTPYLEQQAKEFDIPLKVEYNGHTYKVQMPDKAVRIVGFTVEPKSVPYGAAC
jgi:hypothetical protein